MKKVSILGSTGSIGTQTLSVIREHREQFSVTALCCGKNTELLSRQIEEFAPRLAVTAEEADARLLAQKFPHMDILYGEEGLLAAAEDDSDILLNALMGMRGLFPTYRAILHGKDIALANKETLVVGGELIMKAAAEKYSRFMRRLLRKRAKPSENLSVSRLHNPLFWILTETAQTKSF